MAGEAIGVGLCVLAGLLCLWGGVREVRLQARLRRYGVHTGGLVVDREQAPADDFLTPVIEGADRQGRPVRFRPAATGPGLGLDLGAHVPVVYLPEQPETARAFTRKHRRSRIVCLFAGGVLFLGAAVLATLTR
ncbi:DUF3592 domain-containing protein [Streptomyces sp. NBC_01443]|uniref:DUF3592 domain-containing protein n=1 Tax=Streptomyces sp. NBC_01443 TaxID=2903868 RepID=UPI002251578E|nr:DUF3592 domain-containing protein [Streptomyces sp. NBC_01443]MCX4632315.1 DUF3592 domain-containing protein [Streptomyces sp. NBC_01443]